jgi:hypothetical protein
LQLLFSIPGFKLVYGGLSDDIFTTFEIGEEHVSKMYLNPELRITNNSHECHHHITDDDNDRKRKHFRRIIFPY